MNTSNTFSASPYSKKRVRFAISLFYFGQGVVFATWASRIPDLKSALQLSDAALGSVLLALPVGQLLTMPISGKLTTSFGSRRMLAFATPLYALALTVLALATTGWQLALFLFLFGVSGNLCNIALNTQGVGGEKYYGKPIMTSFHGAWSIGGFSGALIGLLMVNLDLVPLIHFWIIAGLAWLHIFINYRFLIVKQGSQQQEKTKLFTKPQGVLIQLGIIGFCSMATEGAMFDWSGVYFKDIVKAPNSLIILGYASFMVMMACGRFLGDKVIAHYGRKRSLQVSGIIMSAGMFIAVIFPYLIPATIGFMLVGIGVSGIVPMVYSVAGTNSKVAPGIALAMVSGVSYFGFLMGPPLIGYISALSSLQYSYAIIACFGLVITLIVAKISAIK
ncbi:MFS transporter [Pedobacter insulae]|uniref:Predicted arabinose efflux permease, MFS family n=1 Tax=Pedobacter insulae TaxID=414048 RepID=A0A1I2ZDL0_9SPHI|nr:MFS transporter [Pedobacter insulae]SFH35790.1 Predicted arabinose efflux permease, MFS family [Pedobacter insulae]